MTLSPIAQCFLIAAQRGKETLARKQELAAADSTTANAPSQPPQANPVTPTAKPARTRRKVQAAGKWLKMALGSVPTPFLFAPAQSIRSSANPKFPYPSTTPRLSTAPT